MSDLQTKTGETGGVIEVADLVLDKLSLSEDNAGVGQLVDSEKVETEPGTLAVKEVDSEKAKAGSGTCPEKVVDSEQVKAGPGTLADAEAAGVSRIVVDLVRVEPGMAKVGPGAPVNKEAKKKSEAIAATDDRTLNYVRGIANKSAPMQSCLSYS